MVASCEPAHHCVGLDTYFTVSLQGGCTLSHSLPAALGVACLGPAWGPHPQRGHGMKAPGRPAAEVDGE